MATLTDRFLARVSRVTSSNRFVPEIDGLRFLAIGLVVLLHLRTALEHHAPAGMSHPERDPLGMVAGHGGVGVLIFFAISGFILALPFAMHALKGSRKVVLKDYYIRRVTRLEPPYIVVMVGVFVMLVLVHRVLGPREGLPTGSAGELFPHLLASLGYVHNLVFGTQSRINGVAWTLEVEVQFYIMAPLL
jgi:peptidoglycan/LPS O-acetylase OafA/YrhL